MQRHARWAISGEFRTCSAGCYLEIAGLVLPVTLVTCNAWLLPGAEMKPASWLLLGWFFPSITGSRTLGTQKRGFLAKNSRGDVHACLRKLSLSLHPLFEVIAVNPCERIWPPFAFGSTLVVGFLWGVPTPPWGFHTPGNLDWDWPGGHVKQPDLNR